MDRSFLYQDTPKSVAVSTLLATGTLALLTQGGCYHKCTNHVFVMVLSEIRRPIHEFGVITLQLILWPIDAVPRLIKPTLYNSGVSTCLNELARLTSLTRTRLSFISCLTHCFALRTSYFSTPVIHWKQRARNRSGQAAGDRVMGPCRVKPNGMEEAGVIGRGRRVV